MSSGLFTGEEGLFEFTGPHVALSCRVEWDSNLGWWHARGEGGYHGTGETKASAALKCFEAWMGSSRGWHEPER